MSQKTHAVFTCTIGIDTGKNTLHLVGLDDRGTIVLLEKLGRSRIRTRLANIPPCLIGIEAGMATHYVARELIALGHDVRQVPPAYARPFRQAHKNDFRDAYAIAEAVQRPSTRFVPVKTDDQLDLQALHRVRSHLTYLCQKDELTFALVQNGFDRDTGGCVCRGAHRSDIDARFIVNDRNGQTRSVTSQHLPSYLSRTSWPATVVSRRTWSINCSIQARSGWHGSFCF
jgi:hypothetical protein